MDPAALLAGDRPLLADGAAATALFAAGLPLGTPPERWLLDRPEAVRALHQAYAASGAELLLTCSFGGNRRRLATAGLADKLETLNVRAARLARDTASTAPRPVLVAGCIGPTGAGRDEEDEAATGALFAEQALALAAGGVDLLWFETLSTAGDLRAASAAATGAGLPYVATFHFTADGATLAGLAPESLPGLLDGLARPPLALGANCGDGPASVLAIARRLLALPLGRPVIAKPSAGLPALRAGELHYGADPAALAGFARDALAAGAAILGGCCGTTPRHLQAMRVAIDTRPGASVTRATRRRPPVKDKG